MKRLIPTILLGLLTLNAYASSCLDSNTPTGISDDAFIRMNISTIRTGYLTDYGENFEFSLKAHYKTFEAVFVEEVDSKTLRVSKYDTGGMDPKLAASQIRTLSTAGDRFSNREMNDEGMLISLREIHNLMDKKPNPRYAKIILTAREHDFLLAGKIAEEELELYHMTQYFINNPGRTGTLTLPGKESSEIVLNLSLECN